MALDVYRDWLQIKSPDRPVHYYTLLGLRKFEDDRSVIERHYRQRSSLVRRYASGKYAEQSQDLLDELARALLTLTDVGRKAEYDQGLGRKTKRPPTETRPLGQILLDEGMITATQLQDAEGFAEQLGIDLREALVQRRYAKWEECTRALAQHYNMPYLNPLDLRISSELIAKVPAALATREHMCPLLVDQGALLVAVTHALNVELLDSLRFQLGMPVRAVLCSPTAIRTLLKRHYAGASNAASGEQQAVSTGEQEKEEPRREAFSLAGWLWRNAKWLGLIVSLAGLAGGYYAFDNIIGAVVGAVVAAVLFVVLLFRVG